jgi:RNA polymerase sigma-70 factor (ECF subfamily)
MDDTPSSLSTRPSLLLRLRDPADQASWGTFVDTYAPLVYRYARRRGLQDADCADVTQDVMVEAARCLGSFEYQPERGRFRNWLGTLTRRKLARFFRKSSRGGSAKGGADSDEPFAEMAEQPDAAWNDEFNAQVLNVALERIRPEFEDFTWRAFQRVWRDSLPAVEAATELKLPLMTVYSAKSRILKRLREEILLLAEDIPQFVL